MLDLSNCFSESAQVSSVDQDLMVLFENIASTFPSAVAPKQGQIFLTYAQMNIAGRVIAKMISEPGDVLCVHVDRSIYWIVIIYSILRARRMYCPFGESLPLRISKGKLFISPERLASSLIPSFVAQFLIVDEILPN